MSAVAPPSWDVPVIRWSGGLGDGHVQVLGPSVTPTAPPAIITDFTALIAMISGAHHWTGKAAASFAAYSLFLYGHQHLRPGDSGPRLESYLLEALEKIHAACPSSAAVDNATQRLMRCYHQHVGLLDASELSARLLMEARRWQREDGHLREQIVTHLGQQLPERGGVMLYGTAASHPGAAAICGVIAAARSGRRLTVLLAEDAPATVGLRSAAWALTAAGIPFSHGSFAESLTWLRERRVHSLLLGADTIFSDGTVLGDDGIKALGEAAVANQVHVLVASSTTALSTRTMTNAGESLAPSGITLVTEHGPLQALFTNSLARLLSNDDHPPAI